MSSHLHRRLKEKGLQNENVKIITSSHQNLSLTTIEPTEEDDVLYKHYNAIYGEKPEFDAMLSETESTKLGVMEGVGLSSKERENLAATMRRNVELERRVRELEGDLVQAEENAIREQNRLRRDLMGDDLTRERSNWLDKFQDQNEMLQDIYDEMLRGRERLATELGNIKRERDELAMYQQLVQDWASSHAITLGVSPPQLSTNMESTATSLISGVDYSKIRTNELALEQNVETVIRDMRQKHRVERETLLKRQLLERDRLASEVQRFENQYRKDPSDIDLLSETYASLLPRALRHQEEGEEEEEDGKAEDSNVVEKLRATVTALQSKIHKLENEIDASNSKDDNARDKRDEVRKEAEERVCSLMIRVAQLEEESLAQGDRHAAELARMQTDITNKSRIIKSQRANLRHLALKLQQAGFDG